MNNIEILNSFFPDANIQVNDDIYTITDNDKCIDFFIDTVDDNVFVGIKQLNKCRLSGTKILELIELFANYINASYISLDDQSAIVVDETEINFALLYILSYGESWYNKNKYYQLNYYDEKKQWDLIRNSTFEELLPLFLQSNYTESSGYYIDAKEYYECLFGIEVTEDNYMEYIKNSISYFMTNINGITNLKIKNIVNLIHLEIKQDKIDNLNDYIFFISFFANIITYTRYPLIRRL